jgi:hypothetical protein
MSSIICGIIVLIIVTVYYIHKKNKEKEKELADATSVKIVSNTSYSDELFGGIMLIIFIGFIIYTYIGDIKPAFIQMNNWYNKLNNVFDERSIIEIKNDLVLKQSNEINTRTIKWSTKSLYWSNDQKEIRYHLKTSYFNNNLLYIITAEPYDTRFSYNSRLTANIENNDGFSLFTINIRNWEKYFDEKDVQIGFIASGTIQMSIYDYDYLWENKNKIDWKLIDY